ncbi:MAG: ABC transporter ATP-binding protein [Oscillospiraceae bacterium]|nr:ABC transporter ATP-binding protein [Oscillospiraceae bacterium]MDY3937697.1 ABC transporter ATP-binding protein [Oscillospiraceae bacterium]
MYAIELDKVTKKYKDVTAVDSLSFKVEKGKCVSILGVNGAGKTTSIKMMCGIIKPDSGSIRVMGYDTVNERNKVGSVIGVSPQETAVAQNLTVRENLEFIAGIYNKKDADINSVIEKLGLGEVEKKRAGKLSGGYQRRLSIAMAIVTEPEVLFLDEPTLGLDVIARRELLRFIEKLKGRHTVVLTTHYLEEASILSDVTAVMAKGRLKAFGTTDEIIKMSGKETFEEAFIALAGGEDLK